MKENMEERAERLALYIIENQTTVRAAAQKFGISKSTVHTDATKQNGPRSKSKAETVFSFRVRRVLVGVFRRPGFCFAGMKSHTGPLAVKEPKYNIVDNFIKI